MSTATAPAPTSFASLTFDQKLDRLAEVAVKIGLGLRAGQELVMDRAHRGAASRPPHHRARYKAGALLVTTFYGDDPSLLARYQHAPDASFDFAPTWLQDGIAAAFKSGAARLAIRRSQPQAPSPAGPRQGLPRQHRHVQGQQASDGAHHPPRDQLDHRRLRHPRVGQTCLPQRARRYCRSQALGRHLPRLAHRRRRPVAEWQQHGAKLKQRVDLLNAKRYAALHFKSEDGSTDLTVGLADDHLWAGGGTTAGNGIYCQPNIPTEEWLHHSAQGPRRRIVRASKPLSHQGTLIENIQCTFEGGKIVKATASAGEDVLNRLISTDDGARRLGEVALVPHSSPIAQSGVLFWNTLFDENAASHIALGQAYSTCLIGGEKMDNDALTALGANSSLIHVDWMIGSGSMDVDGIAANGAPEPLMRRGEWGLNGVRSVLTNRDRVFSEGAGGLQAPESKRNSHGL